MDLSNKKIDYLTMYKNIITRDEEGWVTLEKAYPLPTSLLLLFLL
jgi:hypothetical protein